MYWMWTVLFILPGLIDNSIGKCHVIYSVSTIIVITLLLFMYTGIEFKIVV